MTNQELSDNDHRVLGQKLDLFSFHEIAPGAPFWHPKGMIVFRELESYARRINDREGYAEISTPIMVKKDVFEKSGHWEHFRDNLFWFKNHRDENETLVLKPMNCPESTYVYNAAVRSYRDLPLRFAELGRLHRNELSGTLGGMFRVRQITMDDAHIFVKKEDAEEEIVRVLKIIDDFYKMFGFEVTYIFATRPEKALGEKSQWDMAEEALTKALERSNITHNLARGEGAFYGPKIEVHIKDSQQRDWQMGTAQLDLVMLPEKFDLAYIDENGKKQKPWVIHRAIFGSFERFIGILLEHTRGALPIWLAPVQAKIITVNDKIAAYAKEIAQKLSKNDVRIELDLRNESIGKKIREAEMQKIPYLLILGDKEAQTGSVSVRERGKGDLGPNSFEEFLNFLK